MVIHDLNIVGIAVTPRKAYTPLRIDPYAVLASTIAAKFLEVIGRRDKKIGEYS